MRLARVHRRVPAHVGHEQEQRVDRGTDRRPRRCGSRCATCRARRADAPTRTPCRCGADCLRHRRSRSSGACTIAERARIERAVRLARLARDGSPAARTSDTAAGSGNCRACRSRRAASAADATCGRCGSRSSARRCRASRASRRAGRSSRRARGRARRSSVAAGGWLARTRRRRARARGGGSCRRGRRSVRATVSGAYSLVEVAFGEEMERRDGACGRRASLYSPTISGETSRSRRRADVVIPAKAGIQRFVARGAGSRPDADARPHSGFPFASRAINPSSAAPGARITSQCAFV